MRARVEDIWVPSPWLQMKILHATHCPGVLKPGWGHGHGKALNVAPVHLLRTRPSLDTQHQGNPRHLERHVETHSWEMYTGEKKKKGALSSTPHLISERICNDISIKLEKKESLDNMQKRFEI